MDISMFDIVENGVSNVEISSTIAEMLKSKYNKEFCIKMIGNRYGTSTDDTVTVFCFPKNNEKLLFTATLNKEETILEDDYYLKKITFELQENIKDIFKTHGNDTIVKTEIMGLNQLEENLGILEFIDKYADTNFLSYIICSKIISDDILKEIYYEIEKKYKNIHLKTLVYFIDERDFEEFCELSKKIPSVTDAIIKKSNVIEEKIIKIFEGNVIIIK